MKTTFEMLINEIERTFNYEFDDAERYAEYLKFSALQEYKNAFKERCITE